MNISLVRGSDSVPEALLTECNAQVTLIDSEDIDRLAQPTAAQPDVVVVDLRGTSALPAGIAELRRQHPTTSVLLVLSHLEPGLMLEAIRAGVNECIAEPLTLDELSAALARLVGNRPAVRHGDVFAVIGAKGGVGATTVAVNLATMLNKFRTASTLLVDMHLTYGDAGVFLGAEPRFTIADAIENLQRLDATFLRALVTQTKSGVSLIPSSDRALGLSVDASQFRQLVEAVATEYPYVVLDVPRSDFVALEALDHANTIIVVANQELATVRSAGRMAATLERRYGKERISVVITRYDEGSEIGQHDVERVVGRPVSYVFPNSYAVAVASLNKGRPLVLDNHTKLATAFSSFARTLVNIPQEREKEKPTGGLLSRLSAFRR
jgi:pilus assembly protein CpaE